MKGNKPAVMLTICLIACASLIVAVPAFSVAQTVTATINVGVGPNEVAVNTGTNKAYVANRLDGTVSVIDCATNTVMSTIPMGIEPKGVAVNPFTNKVYVTNIGSDNVSVIDGATDTVIDTITVGNSPYGIAVNPATNMIYVGNWPAHTVSVIDGATNTVTATITIGGDVRGVCVNPETNKIYATEQGSGVAVINGATNTVTTTIPLSGTYDVIANPFTNKIYVVNQSFNNVSVIDGATDTITGSPIPVGANPSGAGVNIESNRIYVKNYNDDSVSVIDGATDTVVDTVTVGDGPGDGGVAVNPITALAYVSNESGDTVSVIYDPPVPAVTGLSPDNAKAGEGDFTLTVDGSGFISGSVVRWNGFDRTTAYVSSTQLTASIPASDIGSAGAYHVTVFNPDPGGAESNIQPFSVNASTWYLAEGCTGGDFETWVLVQNPGSSDVTVDLTFMTSAGEQDGPQDVSVPANSRYSFNVNSYVTDWDVSTRVEASGEVICERAMYGGNRTWAHDSIGVTRPDTTWYLAEGCTGGDFETWVLVQNPGSSDVTVDLTLMTDGGPQSPPGLQGQVVAGNSRRSFRLNDYVITYNVSTMVEASSEVICERAMYGGNRTWAHDSIGVTASSTAPTVTSNVRSNDYPEGIAVNPATNKVYVTNQDSDDVSVIDGATDMVTGTIPVGDSPYGVAVNPLTNKILVANAWDDSVSVIDGSTDSVSMTIPVGDGPWSVGVNSVTNKAYVVNWNSDSVSVIDTNSYTVVATVPVGDSPSGVGVNHITNKIYIPNYYGNDVSVIDGATNTVTDTIPVGGEPEGVGVNLVTNVIYVANSADGEVSVIDGSTGTVTGTVAVGAWPFFISVNYAANRVYVTNNGDNDVSVINGATNTVEAAIPVGLNPYGVAVNTLTDKVYVANTQSDNVSVIHDPATWYLAEGCTGGDFETWVLVQNPNTYDVAVDLTFMTSAGDQPGPQDFIVPAGARQSFSVNSYVTDWDVSTRVQASGNVICERAMYGGNRTWAHDSIGVTRPDTTWFLAEGCTGGDFETWVLVQNPNPYEVTVGLTFMTSTGKVEGPQGVTLPANSRHSFNVNSSVTDWNVSTMVEATGNVICERAMYGGNRTWAHDSIGYAP